MSLKTEQLMEAILSAIQRLAVGVDVSNELLQEIADREKGVYYIPFNSGSAPTGSPALAYHENEGLN